MAAPFAFESLPVEESWKVMLSGSAAVADVESNDGSENEDGVSNIDDDPSPKPAATSSSLVNGNGMELCDPESRKSKAQSSHPESPVKKLARTGN